MPQDNPKLHLVKGGCSLPKLRVDKYIHMGQFDICISDDGQELQIWKGDTLLKTFK